MSDLTAGQTFALLELFATADTVFDEDAFASPKAMEMSLRRIQRSWVKARVEIEKSAPVFGRGR